MDGLRILVSKRFRDEEVFLEKMQDVLNYEIIEYAYRDVFEILDSVYYRVRVRLETDYLVEFIYYILDDDSISILHIEY